MVSHPNQLINSKHLLSFPQPLYDSQSGLVVMRETVDLTDHKGSDPLNVTAEEAGCS